MKYERLTKRVDNYPKVKSCPKDCETISCVDCGCCDELDYALYRLAELEDKIENGTLVELPCKVGDKVFDITDRPEIWEVEVKGFLIDEKGIWFNFGLYQKRVGLLGIKIFLTKDEAEKRLKELRGEV